MIPRKPSEAEKGAMRSVLTPAQGATYVRAHFGRCELAWLIRGAEPYIGDTARAADFHEFFDRAAEVDRRLDLIPPLACVVRDRRDVDGRVRTMLLEQIVGVDAAFLAAAAALARAVDGTLLHKRILSMASTDPKFVDGLSQTCLERAPS